jgi:ubiquinone biosynthesis protein
MAVVVARRGAIAGGHYARARLGLHDVDGGAWFSRQVRLALEELGPTFVKLGQLLSSRSDVIPRSLQQELSTLRDRAPSIPRATVMAEIRQSIGPTATDPFSAFEMAPVACASVGQVHRAVLGDGRRVAVKVRRPGVRSDIDLDVALLRAFTRVVSLSRRVRAHDPVGLVDEFASMLRAETDYTLEAENIEAIHGAFANDDVVKIPRVVPEVSSDSILIMDWIEGIPLTNSEALDAAGTDRAAVARAIVHAYAAMIFRSDRFHADPHPGNLIAMTGGHIGLVDFGEVGSITAATRSALMGLLMAVLGRDSDSLADAVLSFSRVPRAVNRAAFGEELARLLDPIADASLQELKLGRVLRELLHVLHGHGLVLPVDLAVLVKTVIVCEATADELDPTIDVRSFLGELGS